MIPDANSPHLSMIELLHRTSDYNERYAESSSFRPPLVAVLIYPSGLIIQR